MNSDPQSERARFTALNDVTARNLRIIEGGTEVFGAGLADRVLAKPRICAYHAPPSADGSMGGAE